MSLKCSILQKNGSFLHKKDIFCTKMKNIDYGRVKNMKLTKYICDDKIDFGFVKK